MSKLREKFKSLNCKGCDIPYCEEKCTMLSNLELDQLEQITDDFTDRFGEWLIEPKDKPKGEYTISELRQIFKDKYYE